ncbi:unnamed protein product [Heterobilharzia americana]|nr:unnamed protein product [Heterobilharzia americana]
MSPIFKSTYSLNMLSSKSAITCIYSTKLLIKFLYLSIIWSFVVSGPIMFPNDTTVKSSILLNTTINQAKVDNQDSSNNNETVIPLSNTETDNDIIEIQKETCDDPAEEFVSPVRGTPRCCRKCEIGNGMLRLCSNTEDTQCRPCKPGFEFTSIRSATKKCMQCRRCEELHPLAKTRTECTPTTDTICQCKKSYYMSEKEQTCKPCTICKPGEGIVKPCDWNSDTQCQSCPAGFWSAQTADSVKCIPCQTCEKNQILINECSSVSDTLCCPLTNPNCTHESH